MNNIRNFCIIAHIDHGKSTLADRMLEVTKTIEKRKMQNQVLDNMELERERGITIKMTPVRMIYRPQALNSKSEIQNGFEFGNSDLELDSKQYVLNLIDTPGHIDFSYEVSRALSAVEGVILLVDATQGVQAQTLSVLGMAKDMNLVVIPVVSKVDSPLAMVDEVKDEIAGILNIEKDEILEVSGKTGQGVEALLQTIISKIPSPSINLEAPLKALVFDLEYQTHTGVTVYLRVVDGAIKESDNLLFRISLEKFRAQEVGIFSPDKKPIKELKAGEIGYVVTGVKSARVTSVGDTLVRQSENALPLPGHQRPLPVVWASVFPEDQNDLLVLKQALQKLELSDSSLSFEEESSGVLGKGYRCGFLGLLHLEIIIERLKREFDLDLVITQPSINYFVSYNQNASKEKKDEVIYSASLFPDDGVILKIEEPWIECNIVSPVDYVNNLMPLVYEHEAELSNTIQIGDGRTTIVLNLPLREFMRGFFDRVKSISAGFASVSYRPIGMREANVTRLDILINGEVNPIFSRVVSKRTVETEAEKTVEKLENVLPRQMFELKIQAKAQGRIISSRTIKAFRKDVTQHMYGGDITRKMKLREKQKKGKKKMLARGKLNIPHDVFVKIMKP